MPPQFGQQKPAVGRSLGVAPEQGRSGLSLKALAYPGKRAPQSPQIAQAAPGALGVPAPAADIHQARAALQQRMASLGWRRGTGVQSPGVGAQFGVPPEAFNPGARPVQFGVPPEAFNPGVLSDLASPLDQPSFAQRYRTR